MQLNLALGLVVLIGVLGANGKSVVKEVPVGEDCVGLFYVRYIAYVYAEPKVTEKHIDEIHVGESRVLSSRVPGADEAGNPIEFFQVPTGFVTTDMIYSITQTNNENWCSIDNIREPRQ